MSEYYWVPENFLFPTDGDCLDARPDDGPAALVANHVEYDKLKARVGELENKLEIKKVFISSMNEVCNAEVKHLRDVILMVMNSEQMEKDGHDWQTCKSPSCVFAREALESK